MKRPETRNHNVKSAFWKHEQPNRRTNCHNVWIAVTAATRHNVKSAHQCSMVLSCCLLRGSTFYSFTAPEHWRADFTLWFLVSGCFTQRCKSCYNLFHGFVDRQRVTVWSSAFDSTTCEMVSHLWELIYTPQLVLPHVHKHRNPQRQTSCTAITLHVY